MGTGTRRALLVGLPGLLCVGLLMRGSGAADAPVPTLETQDLPAGYKVVAPGRTPPVLDPKHTREVSTLRRYAWKKGHQLLTVDILDFASEQALAQWQDKARDAYSWWGAQPADKPIRVQTQRRRKQGPGFATVRLLFPRRYIAVASDTPNNIPAAVADPQLVDKIARLLVERSKLRR